MNSTRRKALDWTLRSCNAYVQENEPRQYLLPASALFSSEFFFVPATHIAQDTRHDSMIALFPI